MLGIVAFIGIFVATYYAYKSAKDYGRNALLWAGIVFAIGFGFQVVIPLIAGIIIGIVFITSGTSPEQLEEAIYGYAVAINIVCIIISVAGMLLVLRYLGTIPDDSGSVITSPTQPPPPPKFDGT